MIIIYIFIAIFIAWIWVDYFRLIDIYNKNDLGYFVLTFALGAASVLIVEGVNTFFLDRFGFELNGRILNDSLFCIFKIGLIEEFAKAVPFVVILFCFRKQFKEPVDYLVFISISALGFSAAENVLYFSIHGPDIINGRAILSTVGHMFDTSLIAYGVIRYLFYKPKPGFWVIIVFFALAVISHAFYDFWLLYEDAKRWGWILTILYFFITISVYATILNNSINNSSFFSYKKMIDSAKVSKRLFIYYGLVFLFQFILLTYLENFDYALVNFFASFFLTGFIIIITITRLSRFKLIRERWSPLKLEFPFTITALDDVVNNVTNPSAFARIQIKGEPSYESFINTYLDEFINLNPLSHRNTTIEYTRLTYIEELIFLKDDERIYLARMYKDDENSTFEKVILKPKLSNYTLVNGKYMIVAILVIEDSMDLSDTTLTSKHFDFQEWAFVVPMDELPENKHDLSDML